MDVDITREPLQADVRLADIWPSQREVADAIERAVESDMFRRSYGEVFAGDENWNGLEVPAGDRYGWDPTSTYGKRPPYFDGMGREPQQGFAPITGTRAVALLGDSVTTDHISPAGAIAAGSPAARSADDDLRAGDDRRGAGRGALRHRRRGVRIGIIAGLGREGAEPARHPVRARTVL